MPCAMPALQVPFLLLGGARDCLGIGNDLGVCRYWGMGRGATLRVYFDNTKTYATDQIDQKKVPAKATGWGVTKMSAIHALYHPLAKAQCSTMNSLWTILLYGSMGTCPNKGFAGICPLPAN